MKRTLNYLLLFVFLLCAGRLRAQTYQKVTVAPAGTATYGSTSVHADGGVEVVSGAPVCGDADLNYRGDGAGTLTFTPAAASVKIKLVFDPGGQTLFLFENGPTSHLTPSNIVGRDPDAI